MPAAVPLARCVTRHARISRCLRPVKEQQRFIYRLVGDDAGLGPEHRLQQIEDDNTLVGRELDVIGFVQSIRKQSKVAFAAVKDGSSMSTLQAVMKPDQAQELSPGTAVRLRGQYVACRPGSQQAHELQVSSVDVLGSNDAESNPLQNKYQSPQFLRTIPHLRLRTPANAQLLQLRSQALNHFSSHFSNTGFTQICTPIITASDCEGAGEVFHVTSNTLPQHDQQTTRNAELYFKEDKYLTVSAQLHLEAAALAVGKVWTISPTFRAERSDTSRHLSEFQMLEVEMISGDDLGVIMDQLESTLRQITHQLTADGFAMRQELYKRIVSHRREEGAPQLTVELEDLERRWTGIAADPWPRITYEQAFRILQDAMTKGAVRFEHIPDRSSGLQAEHERYLAEAVGKSCPVFVTDYPRDQKPFYMLPSTNGDGTTAACFDLLVPELGEIAGGSLREYRLEPLEKAMHDKGLLKEGEAAAGSKLDWYLDLRRYGSAPHGGYGLGLDRFLCYISGVSNIRDMVTFPRWYGRCDT